MQIINIIVIIIVAIAVLIVFSYWFDKKLTSMPNKEEVEVKKSTPLNTFFYLACLFFAANSAYQILRSITNLLMPETMTIPPLQDEFFSTTSTTINLTNHTHDIINIIFLSLNIITLLLIVLKKRWSIILFFALHAIHAVVISFYIGNPIVHIFTNASLCTVFAAFLCLRSHGRSCWDIIWNGEKQQDE